jgi:hypothetical protein
MEKEILRLNLKLLKTFFGGIAVGFMLGNYGKVEAIVSQIQSILEHVLNAFLTF